jgi:hypothetical protein
MGQRSSSLIYVGRLADGITDRVLISLPLHGRRAFDCKETVFVKDNAEWTSLGMKISMEQGVSISIHDNIETYAKAFIPGLQTQNQSLPQSIALSKLVHHD